MTHKHTPGLWEADIIGHQVYETSGMTVIATLPLSVSKQQKAERITNARLMAAAPDMLDMLDAIAIWAKTTKLDLSAPMDRRLFDAVNDTINKARGD